MRRLVSVGAVCLLGATALTACSSDPTPSPDDSFIPTIEVAPQANSVPDPEPSLVLTDSGYVEAAPSEPTTTEITLDDADSIVEIAVGDVVPITGLPQDDLHHAIYVDVARGDLIQANQRVINDQAATQSDPTLEGLAPGLADVKIYDTDPGGNGVKELGSFTVHVHNPGGGQWNSDLQGVAATIAGGGMRVGDAVLAAEDAGFTVRVTEVDGVPKPATKDINPKRLNFTVEDGVVTGVTVG